MTLIYKNKLDIIENGTFDGLQPETHIFYSPKICNCYFVDVVIRMRQKGFIVRGSCPVQISVRSYNKTTDLMKIDRTNCGCADNPCMNNGVCSGEDEIFCKCTESFKGNRCQFPMGNFQSIIIVVIISSRAFRLTLGIVIQMFV